MYIGVTNNLARRMYEHLKVCGGFYQTSGSIRRFAFPTAADAFIVKPFEGYRALSNLNGWNPAWTICRSSFEALTDGPMKRRDGKMQDAVQLARRGQRSRPIRLAEITNRFRPATGARMTPWLIARILRGPKLGRRISTAMKRVGPNPSPARRLINNAGALFRRRNRRAENRPQPGFVAPLPRRGGGASHRAEAHAARGWKAPNINYLAAPIPAPAANIPIQPRTGAAPRRDAKRWEISHPIGDYSGGRLDCRAQAARRDFAAGRPSPIWLARWFGAPRILAMRLTAAAEAPMTLKAASISATIVAPGR